MLQTGPLPCGPFAPRLLEHLRRTPSVGADDLARAIAAADLAGGRLDQALIELGIVPEAYMLGVLATELGVAEAGSEEIPELPILGEALPASYLAHIRALPIAWSGDRLVLAMCNPFDDFTAQAIGLKLRCDVTRKLVSNRRFEESFSSLYGDGWLASGQAVDKPAVGIAADLEMLRDAASDAPVVRFVQQMLRTAVDAHASDIHLRPLQHRAEMSFRVNGSLIPQLAPDIGILAGVVSRLKILAGLDISEHRLPQDGRFRTTVAGRQMDVRLSTMPLAHGEGVVLRLLAGEAAAASLAELGFSPQIERGLETLFSDGQGLVLVTGPTGSGKSTTLHAGVRRLVRPDLNVATIEDPIEYRLEGAAQIQVDEKIGLTFPRVLRSLLRQDPDVILLGEIRDGETARIAVQAALTGHLVLATLHTNSAIAAVPRLIDMGVEPYLLAAVLRGVLAQRLVRKPCPHCADGKGEASSCAGCSGSRYIGRVAVGELLLADPDVTNTLAAGHALPDHLRVRIEERGFTPMRVDVEARLAAGEIAPEDARAVLHA